jgi:vitamin B12 transporter
MIRRYRVAFAAALFLAIVLPLGARADSPSPNPSATATPQATGDALTQIGTVVTSDRQPEPRSQTARTTFVVTKTEILDHGNTTVAQALENVPGVSILTYGGPGAAASVSIRGSNSNGVLILLDGQPLAGSEIGGVDLGMFPTTGVERIEVVEGSGATLYGSSAIGGVINIITQSPRTNANTPLATLGIDSFGGRSLRIEDAGISFERRVANGDFSYAAQNGLPSGTRTNDDEELSAARIAKHFVLGDLKLDVDGGLLARDLGVPGPVAYAYGASELTPDLRQQNVNADVRIGASLKRGDATTTLSVLANRATIFLNDPTNSYGYYPEYSTDANVRLNLQTTQANRNDRVIYGLDLAHGVARNDGGPGSGPPVVDPYAQTAAYAQDSHAFGAVRAYLGLRAERDGAAGAALTPALGAIIPVANDLSLRMNLGTGFRVPNAQDLTYPGYSNPTLQPERTKSFDLGLDDARMLDGVSLVYFVQTGTNLIVNNPTWDSTLPNGPGNYPIINAQQSSIAGLTLSATAHGAGGLQARLGLTNTYRANAFDALDHETRIADKPVLTPSLTVDWKRPADAWLVGYGIALHAAGSENDGYGDTSGAYARLDAYLRAKLARKLSLVLRGTNLTNAQYDVIPTYPMPGRGFSIEVTTR